MQNPLLSLRLVVPLTQQELAEKTCISKQYISAAEKGMQYPKPNRAHLASLLRLSGLEITTEQLEREYFEWQHWKQRDTLARRDIPPVAEIEKKFTTRQPNFILFKTWRETYWDTIYSFCEDLCLKQYDVHRYENGQARYMPSSIYMMLYPLGLLEGFNYEAR